jgi:peptidoglycan/LPS O-acetylase OafA/YrhL
METTTTAGNVARAPHTPHTESRDAMQPAALGSGPVSESVGAARLRALLAGTHLPALDGLRAVAVGLVIGFHAGFKIFPGPLGVQVFFVLSGFLITWLLLKEQQRTGDVSLRAFYVRRALRIFPAYYVFLILSALATWTLPLWPASPGQRGMFVAALFYAVNYYTSVTRVGSGAISHAWSLGVEEQFYLLWPPIARRVGLNRPRLVWALAALIIAVVGWRAVLASVWHLPGWEYTAFDTRCDALAAGCLLAILLQRARARELAARLGTWSVLPFVFAAALAYSQVAPHRFYRGVFGGTVDSVLIALLLVMLIQLHDRWLWRWLEWRAVRFCGLISYPLYLYHQTAFKVAFDLTRLRYSAQLLTGLALSVGLATVSYYGVERPFLSLKRRFSRTEVALTLADATQSHPRVPVVTE